MEIFCMLTVIIAALLCTFAANYTLKSLPWLSSKESVCNADVSSIPGLRRSPGEGSGNPLQYSCLGNPTDKEAWQATVHKVSKSWT